MSFKKVPASAAWSRKGKVFRRVNLKISKEIKETWDILVSVGSGKHGH